MPTIKDIAQEAGVSHGTVSNVLNGRGNVSVEKIRLVRETALRLGYKVNTSAQELRQGNTRTVALLVPSIVSEWCAELYTVLQQELSMSGYCIQLYSTHGLEVTEKEALTQALAARVCAVITDSCLADAAFYYKNEADGLPVFFLQQGEIDCPMSCCVSFEYEKGGHEIARYVMREGAKAVGLFTSEPESYVTKQFLQGFQTAVYHKEIILRQVTCAQHQVDMQAFELFETDAQKYDFIVCTDYQRMRAAKIAYSYASLQEEPKFIAMTPHAAVVDLKHPQYGLDYKMMGHRIAKTLLAYLEEGAPIPQKILLENSGFPEMPASSYSAQELTMLTVASPASDALLRLLPNLERTMGIRLQLTVMSLDDIYSVLQHADGQVPYDLIRMDMAWLDEWAASVYQPLDEIPFDWDSLISRFRTEFIADYTATNGVRCCLPYDPSTQLLFYRKDLFENPILRRMYFEANRQELRVPTTFEAYNAVARFFTQSLNPYSPVKFGSTVAIGNAGVSASEYCVRLFGMSGSLLTPEGRISLDTPEALAALQNYKEAYQYSDKTQYQWWKSALSGFAEGSAAMTVVFMNHASDILNLKRSRIAGKIGYATVPGGHPLIGGGIIGVARSSQKQAVACKFLEWLYSAPVASVFTILGGLSPCKSVYDNQDVYEKYPWLTAAKRSFPIAKRRPGSSYYENFSEHQMEKLLSYEVKNAVMGVCTPEVALARAQAACERTFVKANRQASAASMNEGETKM